MTSVRQHPPMTARTRTHWLCGGLLAAATLLSPAAGSAQPSQGVGPVARAGTTVRAARSSFDEAVQVTGALAPRNEVLIRSDREGWQVSQVLVEAGDNVSSGQVLARLRPPDGQRGSDTAVQASSAGVIYAS